MKLAVTVRMYSGPCLPKTEELVRQDCLHRAIEDLLDLRAHRLVLDTRDHRDVHDHRTLWHALGARPSNTRLTYEHLDSTLEPILWVSDAVAWCFGAGGGWADRVAPLIAEQIKV